MKSTSSINKFGNMDWNNPFDCWLAICQDPHNLQYVECQNEIICRKAISLDALVLQHVRDQTLDLCKLAVKRKSSAFALIREQTPELCEWFAATYGAIQYVKEQTPDLCWIALKRAPYALSAILEQTEEMCLYAVSVDAETVDSIHDSLLTTDFWRKLVSLDPEVIIHVQHPNMTDEIYLMAIEQDIYLIDDAPPHLVSDDMWLQALEDCPWYIHNMPKHLITPEIIEQILRRSGIYEIPEHFLTEELYLLALEINPTSTMNYVSQSPSNPYTTATFFDRALDMGFLSKSTAAKLSEAELLDFVCKCPRNIQFIEKPTPEMCWIALEANVSNIRHITNPDASMLIYVAENNISVLSGFKIPSVVIPVILAINYRYIVYVELSEEQIQLAIQLEPKVAAVSKISQNLSLETKVHVIQKDLSLYSEFDNDSLYADPDLYYEITCAAIKYDPKLISAVKHQTYELCLLAASLDETVLKDCHYHSPEIYALCESSAWKIVD